MVIDKDKMVKKFASLLSADASNYKSTIKDLEVQGFEGIHFDVMDSHFVRNFAFNPHIISTLRKLTSMIFETHLEIENPEQYLDMFSNAGSDMITIHPQASGNPDSVLRYLRAKQITSSIAIDSDIDIEEVKDLLPLTDNIIIMCVYPGFGKQEFIENSYGKLTEIRKIFDKKGFNISIAVDGCVNKKTEKKIIDCRADILIYGSSLFRR